MVKLLVVGADGGLGQAVVARAGDPFETVALGHRALDVSRRNDVFDRVREIRPDVIFDAAGVNDVDTCEYDRWRPYLVNRDGAEHLSRAGAEAGALMVYPSCDLIFDGTRDTPYREEDPPNPLSVYADTRLAGELAVMSHALNHLVLRTGWLFGPFGNNLVTEFIRMRETETIVFGYEDQRGQPTSQLEFVDAALNLIRQKHSGVWHVASQGSGTQLDVAKLVYDALKERKVKVKAARRATGGRTALRPRFSVLDCGKLEGVAGIRLRQWKDSLREFVTKNRK